MSNLYFIGIGGIGMSALAKLFVAEGKTVSGSDQNKTLVTEDLEKLAVNINYFQEAGNISDKIDTVIYTIAIPEDHPELAEVKKKGIPVYTYPEMLGIVSKDKYTIAVSGTHGKTTTTAMCADVLIDSGLEPTAIVGSLISRYKSNFIEGNSKYFLVEACEYKRSFLNISPNILAITNIEEDHLDYYKDIDDIKDAFRELARKVPPDGYIVCNPNDANVSDVIVGSGAKIVDYTKNPNIKLSVFGKHNILNAKVAYSIAEILGVSKEDMEEALENFSGTWRRLENKGTTKEGIIVIDDYAHHPSEIKATVEALRSKYKDQKITIVFQPHLFSRTKFFLRDFKESFSGVDKVIISPIYAAREVDDGSIDGSKLAEEVGGVYAESIESIPGMLGEEDVVVTMGAGDIYKVGDMLLLEN